MPTAHIVAMPASAMSEMVNRCRPDAMAAAPGSTATNTVRKLNP